MTTSTYSPNSTHMQEPLRPLSVPAPSPLRPLTALDGVPTDHRPASRRRSTAEAQAEAAAETRMKNITTLRPHHSSAETRTMKQRSNSHLATLILVAMLTLVGGQAVAQNHYVLTNGSSRLVSNINTSNPWASTYIDNMGYKCISDCDNPARRTPRCGTRLATIT